MERTTKPSGGLTGRCVVPGLQERSGPGGAHGSGSSERTRCPKLQNPKYRTIHGNVRRDRGATLCGPLPGLAPWRGSHPPEAAQRSPQRTSLAGPKPPHMQAPRASGAHAQGARPRTNVPEGPPECSPDFFFFNIETFSSQKSALFGRPGISATCDGIAFSIIVGGTFPPVAPRGKPVSLTLFDPFLSGFGAKP